MNHLNELITESSGVKCCHRLAAASGGVLAAQPFLFVTISSLFSAFLTDASFQNCFITFSDERSALNFVTVSYALRSWGKYCT